jgi:hypothetical protein
MWCRELTEAFSKCNLRCIGLITCTVSLPKIIQQDTQYLNLHTQSKAQWHTTDRSSEREVCNASRDHRPHVLQYVAMIEDSYWIPNYPMTSHTGFGFPYWIRMIHISPAASITRQNDDQSILNIDPHVTIMLKARGWSPKEVFQLVGLLILLRCTWR